MFPLLRLVVDGRVGGLIGLGGLAGGDFSVVPLAFVADVALPGGCSAHGRRRIAGSVSFPSLLLHQPPSYLFSEC